MSLDWPSLVYPQVGGPGSATTCPAGIPGQDGVPLEWAAPWGNPQMMRGEGERGMFAFTRVPNL